MAEVASQTNALLYVWLYFIVPLFFKTLFNGNLP